MYNVRSKQVSRNGQPMKMQLHRVVFMNILNSVRIFNRTKINMKIITFTFWGNTVLHVIT